MASIVGWTVDKWPFTMARFLDFYTMIFKEDGSKNVDLYEAYCGTDDEWVATQVIDSISTIDNPDVYPINIDFADFGWFYALAYAEMSSASLDVKCYYRDPDVASGLGAISTLPIDSCPEFITCCNFKGQMIIGGIFSSDASWTKLGLASVAWGAIGQFEFRPSQNRTAGYIRMPWSDWDEGLVHKVARLGGIVMVYGNGGRAALKPFNEPMAAGFGLIDSINGTGIDKGFHMAGDSSLHGFIDTRNYFWVVDKSLTFTKLGYREWIEDMLAENLDVAAGTPIVVSYDPKGRRFYICGHSSSYVLTQWGLYSCHQSSSGVGRYRGKILSGFYKDLGDYEGRIKLAERDFGQRGMKTVDHLDVGVDYTPSGDEDFTIGVDVKYDRDESFREGDWVRVNKQGLGYLGKTAPDFRVKAKVSDYRDGAPKLDSMKIRWKMVDKRSIRGQYDAGSNR